MSQITTHILDTSMGKPAQGVLITLEKPVAEDSWTVIGMGHTNADGRLPGLLDPDVKLEPGVYRLVFDTNSYYEQKGVKGLYPFVTIAFEVTDQSHYHIPLLLNPFGYSTYRGS